MLSFFVNAPCTPILTSKATRRLKPYKAFTKDLHANWYINRATNTPKPPRYGVVTAVGQNIELESRHSWHNCNHIGAFWAKMLRDHFRYWLSSKGNHCHRPWPGNRYYSGKVKYLGCSLRFVSSRLIVWQRQMIWLKKRTLERLGSW